MSFHRLQKKKQQTTFEPPRKLDLLDDVKNQRHTRRQKSTKFPELPPLNFQRKTIDQHLEILDIMGFGSKFETSADVNSDNPKLLKRRLSIGISDFWSEHDRERFIRNNGYWDAYKKLQKEDILYEIKSKSSIRKPSIPYVMDCNVKRRMNSQFVNTFGSVTERHQSMEFKFSEYTKKNTLKGSKEKRGPIEEVVNKCKKLAEDTMILKKRSARFHDSWTQKLMSLTKPKKSN